MTAVSPQHRIARICALIESDLSRPWRTNQLADACAMAQHHLQGLCATATGQTVAGYFKSRRLHRPPVRPRPNRARTPKSGCSGGARHAGLFFIIRTPASAKVVQAAMRVTPPTGVR
mgnify:CR=1 FL=1